MAPAWPMVLPSGAWAPEMRATRGFGYRLGSARTSWARSSSWQPPISPATMTRSVFPYSMARGTRSRKVEPMAPSPPMPMTAFWAIPTLAMASDMW